MLKTMLARLSPSKRWKAHVLVHTARALRDRAIPLSRTCPLCHYEGLFRPFGWPVRPEAACPQCGSLERHRLLKLWVDSNLQEIRGRSVLHFAPEKAILHLLRPLASEYVTADLSPGHDLTLDIERLDLPDGRFQVIVCSHVLEHVDDRAALAEIRRVLQPGGLGLIMIPLVEAWSSSYEDPGIQSERDREIYFGQSDHVRVYGADFRSRAKAAGFALEEFTAVEPDSTRYGLLRGEKVFLLRRPQ